MSLTAGTRLGPYEIRSLLGAGGMGAVYAAYDSRLDRDVAVKVLPPEFADDADRRARFEREARAIAALSHPNVLAVYDTGTHDGQLFVVTELLQGQSLADRLLSGPLSVRKAIDYAAQIARGLAAAHDRHIVHRDLKPANIFLLHDGTAKVLDFGLARQIRPGGDDSQTVEAGTNPGVVMGTAAYMSPEQVRGETVDARSDLFAFGAVLYEMLSGRRAFRGESTAETMSAVLRDEPPPLSGVRDDIPPPLERIVHHCLEKVPSERFQSARDVAFAVESLADSGQTSTVRSLETPPVSRPAWIPIALVALVAAAAAAAVFLWSGRRGTVSGAPVSLGSTVALTATDGLEISPSMSPEGRIVAYAAGTEMDMRIYTRSVMGGQQAQVSADQHGSAWQPRWSPSGDRLLYVAEAGVYETSAPLGGDARLVVPGEIGSAAWSPDERRLAVARESGVAIVDLATRQERVVSDLPTLHSCDWAPNDVWLACVQFNASWIGPGPGFGNSAPSAIVLVPVAGGPSIVLMGGDDETTQNQSPVWSSDSARLYFVSNRQGQNDVYVVDMTDGPGTAEPVNITSGLGVHSISLSADEARLAYATYSAQANIVSVAVPEVGSADDLEMRVHTSGNQIVEAMSLSPDGTWLLYDSNLHGNFDLFRVPVDGNGDPERLTDQPEDEFAPELSPDGLAVAFHSFRFGGRDLIIRRLGDGAEEVVTNTSSESESYPAFSPDGRSLSFAMRFGAPIGLYLMRRDAAGQWSDSRLLRAGLLLRHVWIDDRHIAYAMGGAVEVVDVETEVATVVYAPSGPGAPLAHGIAASDDGRTLYFKSLTGGMASFWSLPATGGIPTRLFSLTDPLRPSNRLDFEAGAGRVLFTLEDRRADVRVAELIRR